MAIVFSSSITIQYIVFIAVLILLASAHVSNNNPHPFDTGHQGGNPYCAYGQFYGNPISSNGSGNEQAFSVDLLDGRPNVINRRRVDLRELEQMEREYATFIDPYICQLRCYSDCEVIFYAADRANAYEEVYSYCAKLRPPQRADEDEELFYRPSIFKVVVSHVMFFAACLLWLSLLLSEAA